MSGATSDAMSDATSVDLATHIGPTTRTVAESALMIEAMAGRHVWDHTSLEAPPQDDAVQLNVDLRGKRVAFSPDLGHARVDGEVATLARRKRHGT